MGLKYVWITVFGMTSLTDVFNTTKILVLLLPIHLAAIEMRERAVSIHSFIIKVTVLILLVRKSVLTRTGIQIRSIATKAGHAFTKVNE